MCKQLTKVAFRRLALVSGLAAASAFLALTEERGFASWQEPLSHWQIIGARSRGELSEIPDRSDYIPTTATAFVGELLNYRVALIELGMDHSDPLHLTQAQVQSLARCAQIVNRVSGERMRILSDMRDSTVGAEAAALLHEEMQVEDRHAYRSIIEGWMEVLDPMQVATIRRRAIANAMYRTNVGHAISGGREWRETHWYFRRLVSEDPDLSDVQKHEVLDDLGKAIAELRRGSILSLMKAWDDIVVMIPSRSRELFERKFGVDLLEERLEGRIKNADGLIEAASAEALREAMLLEGYSIPLLGDGSMSWGYFIYRSCFDHANDLRIDNNQRSLLLSLLAAERQRLKAQSREPLQRIRTVNGESERNELRREIISLHRQSSRNILLQVHNILEPEQLELLSAFACEALFWANETQLWIVFDSSELDLNDTQREDIIRRVLERRSTLRDEMDRQAESTWNQFLSLLPRHLRIHVEEATGLAWFRK